MLGLSFYLNNPFAKKEYNEDSFHYVKSVTKNKTLEIQFRKDFSTFISFNLYIRTKVSHAGILLGFGLFGFDCDIEFCDNRHWDDENNCWEKYSNED